MPGWFKIQSIRISYIKLLLVILEWFENSKCLRILKITFIYYTHINIENIDNNQSWLIVYIKERATLLQMYTSLVNKRWYQEDSATPTRLKTLIMYCNINKPCL